MKTWLNTRLSVLCILELGIFHMALPSRELADRSTRRDYQLLT
jgi:hypothetical protein